MASLKQFRADDKMAKEGVAVPFGEPDPETGKTPEFRVAYSGNDAYRARIGEIMRRAQRQMPGRDLPSSTVLALQREAMIGTVLLGWSGLFEEDETGKEDKTKELPFTKENAALVLGTPVLYGIIEGASNNLALFQEEQEAASKAAVKGGGAVEPPLE